MTDRKRPDDGPAGDPPEFDPEYDLKKLAALAGPFLEGLLSDAIAARDRAKVEEQLRMDQPDPPPFPGPVGLAGGRRARVMMYASPLFHFQTIAGINIVVMDDGTTRFLAFDDTDSTNAFEWHHGPTIPGGIADAIMKMKVEAMPDTDSSSTGP